MCQPEDMNKVIQNLKKQKELNFLLNHKRGYG